MNQGMLIDVSRDAIFVFLRAGVPLMLVGLLVGFIITLAQALTQIQEQTLVYVPKIVSVLGALIFLAPFMGDALSGLMARIAERIVSGQ